jgi:hypothetical protein
MGATGFTRKSAVLICSSVRATFASNVCVITMIGGQLPTRAISRASASISSGRRASRSTTATVASVTSSESTCSARLPETILSSIAEDAPKVVRTEFSNSVSALRTTTRVRFVSGACQCA